jgi:hypothetical protein
MIGARRKEDPMNAIAHDPLHISLDRVVNLWPEDSAEDTLEMGLRQRAGMVAALGVALVTLVLAIVLQTAYHGVILLWIWLGLPLLLLAKAIAHIGAAGLERVRAAFGPDAFARLQALKSRYDPNNALRRNQNIPPAG